MDLSSNPLTKLVSDMIVDCNNIVFFFLHDIHLLQTNKAVFEGLRLKMLNTTDYRLCCLIKDETECTSIKPQYVSCNDLVGTTRIKICYSCISFTIISLNLIYFILQIFLPLNPFKIITISITLTDFSYGLCIAVLLMADQYFNDNFPVDEMKWRSSFMCILSFSLALNFSLLSPLSLSFLSVQRCLVIVFPLNAKYKNKQFAVKWLTGIFIVSIVLCYCYMCTYEVLKNNDTFNNMHTFCGSYQFHIFDQNNNLVGCYLAVWSNLHHIYCIFNNGYKIAEI